MFYTSQKCFDPLDNKNGSWFWPSECQLEVGSRRSGFDIQVSIGRVLILPFYPQAYVLNFASLAPV